MTRLNLPFSSEEKVPSLNGATQWFNSSPLTPADLRGNVVLVNFWTYTSINWLHTLPYIRAWVEKYQDHGLVVIGIHTPEFPFEHDLDNVCREAAALGIHYPIALDIDRGLYQQQPYVAQRDCRGMALTHLWQLSSDSSFDLSQSNESEACILDNSIRLLTIRGIDIRVHVTFPPRTCLSMPVPGHPARDNTASYQ